MSLTKRQREVEVFALVREIGEWKEIRNAADRRLRALRAQVEALAHPPKRNGRAALAVRLVELVRESIAPSAHERKRGFARRDDIEGRVRTLARKFRVTPPEREGGAHE